MAVFPKTRFLCIPVCVALFFSYSTLWAQRGSLDEALQLQPREAFTVELPKLFVSIDDETREFDGVRITFPPDFNDQVFIGTYDDMYIKFTSNGRERVQYRELPEKAGFLSKFEAKNLVKVNEYFISTLDIFEKLLQKNSWGR